MVTAFLLRRAPLVALLLTISVTSLTPSGVTAMGPRAGQADPSFGESENGLQILQHADPNFSPRAATAARGGELYVTGNGNLSSFAILKMDGDGRMDPDFGIIRYKVPPGFSAGAFYDVKVSPEGDVVAAGYINDGNVGDIVGIACKTTSSGELDPSFAPGSVMPGCALIDSMSMVNSVVIKGDGSVLLSGMSEFKGGPVEFAMVRVDATGVIDQGFAGGGVAHLPDDMADSEALWSLISEDESITTLARDAADYNSVILARHTADGQLDTVFSGDGAMNVMQHVQPVGMAVDEDGSVVLAVIPQGDDVRALTLMKFDSSGNPALEFQGPDAPPGRAQINLCNADCTPAQSYFARTNDMFRVDANRVVIGAVAYYPASMAGRAIAVRVDATTGLPDPTFGDESTDDLIGVGRGMALSIASPDDVRYFTAQRGDRLMVLEQRLGSKIAAWSFLGDRMFADGFE